MAAARTAVAREYRMVAELVASEDRQFAHNAAGGNAVLAAIAAADAICCLKLGRYHAGEDHHAAAKLLAQVSPDGPILAKHLAKVLAVKDQVHYSGDPIPESRMLSVLTGSLGASARQLIARAVTREMGTGEFAERRHQAAVVAGAGSQHDVARLDAVQGDGGDAGVQAAVGSGIDAPVRRSKPDPPAEAWVR